MEYVDGWNLSEYLNQHTLNVEKKIRLCRKIAEAVHVIHHNGFVHRDLKPENIMVNRDHEVKITDFGISLQQSMARSTVAGALIGTPLYMSPEQINNLELTSASDIFSLGIIFYEIITGFNPFNAKQYGEIFANILTRTPESPESVAEAVPGWFSRLIGEMLEKEPGKRIQTASELLQKFPASGASEQVTTGSVSRDASKHEKLPSNSGNKRTWIPVAMALLISIILIIQNNNTIREKLGWSKVIPDTLTTEKIPPDTSGFDSDSTLPGDTTANSQTEITEIRNDPNNRDPGSNPVQSERKTDTSIPTTFFIETNPWSKDYLDYKYLDTVPLDSAITIKPGRYLLSLRHPAYVLSWSDSIQIKPHERNTFAFNLDSLYYRLDLDVHPWGKVYVDDRYVGDTPLTDPLLLTRRDHQITIKNDYYESWQDTLHWNGEKHVTKKIVLREIQ
jgi:serine/threonine-protein kinase